MDFSSVYVVVNLQTWVLLFDYLGIGVPTPPPSRPSSAEPPDLLEGPLTSFEPPTSLLSVDPGTTLMAQSSAFVSALDHSLLQDAMDFTSLGSENGFGTLQSGTFGRAPSLGEGKVTSQISSDFTVEGSSLNSVPSTETSIGREQVQPHVHAADSTVWGVEGKISMEVTLNVKSLTVTFNKLEHPLARGNVSSLGAQLQLSKGNMNISGSLGQASVIDLTETGAFYRERYMYVHVCCTLIDVHVYVVEIMGPVLRPLLVFPYMYMYVCLEHFCHFH